MNEAVTIIWGCCAPTKENEGKSFVRCTICKKVFHHDCLALDPSSDRTSWACSTCNSKTPESNQVFFNTNITVRSHKRQALQSPPDVSSSPVTEEGVRSIVTEVLQANMDCMLEKINLNMKMLLMQELNAMREQIAGYKNSVDYISQQYDDLLQDKKQLEEQVRSLQKENRSKSTIINDLAKRLNMLEQHARSSNIEIQCVPEHRSENVVNTVFQLSKVIKCEVKETDIQLCTRTAKKDKENSRPRSILVKFNSPRLRDSFLAAAIQYNKSHPNDKLNASHLGIATTTPSPVFVAEHLSSENKALHAATRLRAKELKYKFVWIRYGKIFTKKDESTPSIWINSLEKLNSLS